ncbi:MAG TPA: DUF3352 domain-containing protein [Thermomicrobiales bacterium]|nr:DUF3352 domain-containing protein [Thermomicrobiales bacterium]
MIRSQYRALVFLATLLLVLPMFATAGMVTAQDSTPTAAEPSPPPMAEAMPADVQAFVSTEFDLESDQYVQLTGLTARVLIPGAGDTVAAIVERLAGFVSLVPDDAREVLEGEVGIGATGFRPLDLGDSQYSDALLGSALPGYAIVLHPRQASTARQIVEDWYTGQLATQGLIPERSEVGSIVILKNPDPSTASFATNPAVVVFAGDYILLGDDHDDMLPFIEAIQGNVPTLADSADLLSLNAALPAERLLFGYIGGETMTASAAGIFDSSALAESIDPPFGTTAFAVSADDPGLRFESVSMPVTGTLLRATPGAANPDFAASIPDSTLAMFAGNNLGDSWLITQVEKVLLSVLMSSLGGGEIDMTDTDLDAQFGVLAMLTGINFKTDLLEQLQGTYGAALFSIDTEDPGSSSAVVASELEDFDRVSVGATSLGPLLQSAAAGSVSITTSSVADQTVNNVTLYSDDQTATIQYGVVNDQLMVGLGDGISTLAQQPTTALADDPSYQAALSELPPSYSSLLYVDLRSIAQQVAPYLIETLAAGSDNPIAQCLVQNVSAGTPVPARIEPTGAAGAICSLIGTIFGGDALEDFLVSRIPGPIAAVAYQANGLQHISGVLLVGSNS